MRKVRISEEMKNICIRQKKFLGVSLVQGWPTSVLETHSPVEFSSNPNPPDTPEEVNQGLRVTRKLEAGDLFIKAGAQLSRTVAPQNRC